MNGPPPRYPDNAGSPRIGPRIAATQPTSHATTVKTWTRNALGVDNENEATIFVSELTCSEPGCPPVETVIAIFGPSTTKVMIHKPLREITQSDVDAALAAAR